MIKLKQKLIKKNIKNNSSQFELTYSSSNETGRNL
jgi:hypothetical protein